MFWHLPVGLAAAVPDVMARNNLNLSPDDHNGHHVLTMHSIRPIAPTVTEHYCHNECTHGLSCMNNCWLSSIAHVSDDTQVKW